MEEQHDPIPARFGGRPKSLVGLAALWRYRIMVDEQMTANNTKITLVGTVDGKMVTSFIDAGVLQWFVHDARDSEVEFNALPEALFEVTIENDSGCYTQVIWNE